MKLIRWLFSNIILIAFVLALTYAYVYWDNLTGEDTPVGQLIAYLSVEYDEVREFVDEYDLVDHGAKTEPAPEVVNTVSVPQVTPPVQQMQPPAQQAAPPPTMAQQPPMRQYSRPTYRDQVMTQPPVRQPYRPRYPAQSARQERPAMPQYPQMPPRREPMAMPESEPVPVLEHEPMSGQSVTIQEPASSTRELWVSAREEYHRGNIDVAIRNYKEVIATSTDNYDAYGELGNVYLSRGSDKEAAGAYYEAAAILVKLGYVDRARSLLPMLGRLDSSKAEALNQLISGVSG